MQELQELATRCKCGVYVSINEHRDNYQTVEQFINERCEDGEVDLDIRSKMIESNTVIQVQFYPDTPVGFYCVYHYDLNSALKQAISCVE